MAIQKQAEAIREKLLAQGVGRVEVEYDGYGDCGMIESIEAFDTANETTRDIVLPSTLRESIADFVSDLLDERFYGWEDGCGARGRVTWNLLSNELRHEHASRFEDYHTTILNGWRSEANE